MINEVCISQKHMALISPVYQTHVQINLFNLVPELIFFGQFN